ncbi:MAG: ABC transporter permease [Devosia sp.]|jgi:peptide/nickel transport system permease protein
MRTYALFALKRFVQLLVVILCGCSIAFFISHLSPISPVDQVIQRVTGRSNFNPDAIIEMRRTLTELFGLDVPLYQQYLHFLARLPFFDFGPSLLAFPTPATALIALALPWTIGLLTFAVIVTWVLGNVAGVLAGYFPRSRLLAAIGMVFIGIQPIPYYIVAFMLVIIFGFLWPVLPISGGFAMNVRPGWTWQFILSIAHYAILPALSLVLVGIGGWFLAMRSLVSNIVSEDYVVYAELAGVRSGRIVRSYLFRNAAVPQLTALAMVLGSIFSGTVITEQVFTYPGLGSLLVNAVNGGDTAVVLAISCVSIVAVATGIFLVDLAQPLIDPRVKPE